MQIKEFMKGAAAAIVAALSFAAWFFKRRADRESERADNAEQEAKERESREKVRDESEQDRRNIELGGADSARERLRDDWTRDSSD